MNEYYLYPYYFIRIYCLSLKCILKFIPRPLAFPDISFVFATQAITNLNNTFLPLDL